MGRAGRDLQFVSKEVMACDARDTGRVTDNSKVLCRSGSHISRCCVINQGTKKREEVLGETGWMCAEGINAGHSSFITNLSR